MSLYGHDRPTTPRLERWAQGALVYENAISTASSTMPSHASMFTGLLPTEHGTHEDHAYLDAELDTLAEQLQGVGYQTYLWAANPHLSRSKNFTQGFELAEHPWSPTYRNEALQIVQDKLPEHDHSSELPERLREGQLLDWSIKAAGRLAHRGVEQFLGARDPARPWFVFVNYMEAHRPFIPPRRYREALMTPQQVERSYQVDRSWDRMWAYTFGLERYTEEELEIQALTYDATLLELDDLLADLLESLEARGLLENTVVVLTADHGELLGEHQLLDHQYSLYSPLTHVPLVIQAPGRLAPGRTDRPVSTLDLFPTLLAMAGAENPVARRSLARDLGAAEPAAWRLSEYPSIFTQPFSSMRSRFPDFDGGPFRRRLRALHSRTHKLIEFEDGHYELYDLAEDPLEQNDLWVAGSELGQGLRTELFRYVANLQPAAARREIPNTVSEQERLLLEGLGYSTGQDAADLRPLLENVRSSWKVTDAKR